MPSRNSFVVLWSKEARKPTIASVFIYVYIKYCIALYGMVWYGMVWYAMLYIYKVLYCIVLYIYM